MAQNKNSKYIKLGETIISMSDISSVSFRPISSLTPYGSADVSLRNGNSIYIKELNEGDREAIESLLLSLEYNESW